MASPHPSLELSFRSRSLTPAPIDGQTNPGSRAESPAERIEDTATMRAWRNARDTYRRSLPDKDFKRIMIPAGPEDVLQEIKKWQSRQKISKYCRVADSVEAGFSRLQKFNRAVDLIAQGTPAPGCLVWGSIIFALTIVQKAAEEYTKLCNALIRMAECLPSIELYTETFLHSRLVQDCVNAFYSSVLRFWTRACKFYRRHRLWNFVRVVWNDYDAEFRVLEDDMLRCQCRVQESALAEHMGESKAGRTQQLTNISYLLEAQSSSRQKDIITWLAPTGYAVDYYMEDFESAKAARHANTCQWLLVRNAFVQFDQATQIGGSFLWIYAQPGAGKTVLAAFLVDHFALHQQSGCVLFFFCKDTDDDKRTPIAIARSLLYQLFHTLRERANISALMEDLALAMEESGHKTALNFSTVWKILSNHVSDLTPATIIVDALDECRDSAILIQSLRSMASSYNVRVILTSRKEEHLYQLLHQSPSLEVAKDDIDADVNAFVEAKVAASPQLSQPSVKTLVIKRLCESHEGMFLWVQYMVKELKSCVSLQQVLEELQELPKGLDAVYQRILQRLQETLDKQTFRLCSKVLTWVTTSLRPLKIDELRQALETHYLNEGHSLLSTDGSFPYSDRDIELVCGSLVTVRSETLQIVHLTVKQYIQSRSGSTTLRLLAEMKDANLQLTLSCLSFLKHKCAEPIVELFPKRPIAAEENKLDLSLLRSEKPFLEYACFSWLVHLTECTNIEALAVSRSFYRTFDSPSTFGWIESCMALQPGSVSRLLIGLEDVRDWIDSLRLDGVQAEDSSFSFVSNWCTTMEQLLEEYSPAIKDQPAVTYYLDFALTFAAHGLTETYEKHGGLTRREMCLRFPTDKIPQPARKEVPPCRQLQKPYGASGLMLDLFIYEPKRNIYIYSYWLLRFGKQVLFAQSASSGRRLPPMSEPEIRFGPIHPLNILSYAMSEDGGYLGIVYKSFSNETPLLIAIWEIDVTLDFTRRMQAFPWARVIHRSTIDEPAIPRLWSNPSITFDRDGVCFTPNGLVRTASDANPFFRDNSLQRLSENGFLDIQCAFYSGNGKFLFVSSNTMITKYSFPDLEFQFKFSLSDTKRYTLVASPSGRYLAIVACHQDRTASDPTETQNDTLLVDTLLENTMVLPHSDDSEQTKIDYVLHFSSDEREAVACYHHGFSTTEYLSTHYVCYIYCYAGLPDGAYIRASGKWIYDSGPLSNRLYVSSDYRTAGIVTESGEIQRIRLGDEIEFLDAPDQPSEYPFRSTFLSQDGSRCASVYYGDYKAQIQTHTVLNPDEMPGCIELQRTSPLSDDRSTSITMSMDLSVLVLDEDIYYLRHSKTGVLSTTLQTLKLPRELQTNLPGRSPKCIVDPSNSYVAYHTQKRYWETGSSGPDVLALFRINSDETSSPRLQPSLPQDMFNISLEFHPSIRMLIVLFGLISEAGDLQSDNIQYSFHVVVIDLETMSKRAVDFELNPSFYDSERYLYASIGLSSSGDFAYITALGYHQIIDRDTKVSPKSYRYIQGILAIDGAFYQLYDSGPDKIGLSLSKPEPTRWGVARHTVDLSDLVFLSSSYENSFSAFLILGKTDEEQMQVLLVPNNDCAPELKSVPLTWAEARAILDQKWETRYGRPL